VYAAAEGLEYATLDLRVRYISGYSYGDYTTNLPVDELVNRHAFVAYEYDSRCHANIECLRGWWFRTCISGKKPSRYAAALY